MESDKWIMVRKTWRGDGSRTIRYECGNVAIESMRSRRRPMGKLLNEIKEAEKELESISNAWVSLGIRLDAVSRSVAGLKRKALELEESIFAVQVKALQKDTAEYGRALSEIEKMMPIDNTLLRQPDLSDFYMPDASEVMKEIEKEVNKDGN